MARPEYRTLLAAVGCLLAPCLGCSALESKQIASFTVTIPRELPGAGKALLDQAVSPIEQSARITRKSAEARCSNSVRGVIRPLVVLGVAEDSGFFRYAFCGDTLVAAECTLASGEQWRVFRRLDGSLLACSGDNGTTTERLEFHRNGCIARYSSGSSDPRADGRVEVLQWTSDGTPKSTSGPVLALGNTASNVSQILETRKLRKEIGYRAACTGELSRQYLAALMVRTDPLLGLLFNALDPARTRFETALCLGNDLVPYMEKATKQWTDVAPSSSYYVGRWLAFGSFSEAKELSARLASNNNECIALIGCAGLAGHRALAEATRSQASLLDMLGKAAAAQPVLRPGTAADDAVLAYGKLAALILERCGNERVVEEALAQLRGDARRLGLAGVLCDVLGDARSKTAIPLLRELLSDGNFGFPDCALRSLMRLGDKDAFPLAAIRLQTMKERVDEKSLLSLCDLASELEALTGETCYDDASAWRTWWEANRTTWSPPVCPEDVGRGE